MDEPKPTETLVSQEASTPSADNISATLPRIEAKLRSVRYGEVRITLKAGRVVEIVTAEKELVFE
jgi:hypothetical protein